MTQQNPPCRQCRRVHVFTDANGWRARDDNGTWHAYDRRPAEYVEGEAITIGEPDTDGFDPAVLSAFLECRHCGGLFDRRRGAHLDRHREFHRAIDEVVAVAWRLANERGGKNERGAA